MNLLFISCNCSDGIYSATELTHSLEVMADSRPELIDKIKQKVIEHFEPIGSVKIVLREIVDEVLEMD